MDYEEDFVNEEVVEFNIDGRMFKYKPTTAGDEFSWIDEYMETVEEEVDGQIVQKQKQNLEKVSQCKIRNLVEVPYTQELIKKIIGIDKSWEKLDKDERWNLIKRLKPTLVSEIMMCIQKIDSALSQEKKN
jgi:hypothetical protein